MRSDSCVVTELSDCGPDVVGSLHLDARIRQFGPCVRGYAWVVRLCPLQSIESIITLVASFKHHAVGHCSWHTLSAAARILGDQYLHDALYVVALQSTHCDQ